MSGLDDLAEQVNRVTHSSQLKSIVGRLVAELRHADDERGVSARLDALSARLDAVESRLAETEQGDGGDQGDDEPVEPATTPAPAKKTTAKKATA